MEEAKWYAVHTFSGYENKVKADIEKTIKNRNLQDQILEVMVPLQEVTELKEGKKKTSMKKLFPAYVLVHMVMNNDTWYIVRNTRGVTGFVGPGSEPSPLSEEEMIALSRMDKCEDLVVDLAVGDLVTVTQEGYWEGKSSVIQAIDMENQTVTITVDMFGGERPVELSFTDVKKK